MSLLTLSRGRPPQSSQGSGLWFEDGFERGDFSKSATRENDGWNWFTNDHDGGQTTVTDTGARTGTYCARFQYGPDAPGSDSSAEVRFSPGKNLEAAWIEWWWLVPSNWQMRDESPSNNKLLRVWKNGYNDGVFSITWEYQRTSDNSARTRMIAEQTGGSTNEVNANPFISPSGPVVPGQWAQIRLAIKTASGLGQADGYTRLYVDGVKVAHLEDFEFWNTAGDPETNFDAGNVMGWANSGYAEETAFLIDDFKVYDEDPGWE